MFVFWGQIQIAPFNPNPTTIITPEPIAYDAHLVKEISAYPNITAISPFAVKPAILFAHGIMEGIKLKGIDSSYNQESSDAITFTGASLDLRDSGYAAQILLSQATLNKLDQKEGDSLLAYFVDPEQQFPRVRKLQIAGTYHTGMEEIDQNFAFCDLKLLRRISNWQEDAIHGYQVTIQDYRQADTIADHLYQEFLDPPMNRSTLQKIYPNIFSWLGLMDTNTYIILVIMAIIAVINLSTALLIFIMERTHMVGVLKTLGMPAAGMQRIFLYHAARVAIKGIFIGILIGVGICLLQQYTQFIRINESAYYMQYVPIKLVGWHVALIGAGTLICCILIMLIPSLIVKKISIVKALRFK